MYEFLKKTLTITALISVIIFFVWSAFFKQSITNQTQYQAMRTENYNVNNNENININFMFSTLTSSRGWVFTYEVLTNSQQAADFICKRLGFFQQMYSKTIFDGNSRIVLYPIPSEVIKTNVYTRVEVVTNTSSQRTRGILWGVQFPSIVSIEGNSNDGIRLK